MLGMSMVPAEIIGSVDKSGGAAVTLMGRVSPPFSLVQNRTDDFGASFAHLRRKYLQPLPQVLASVLASTCTNHQRTYNQGWTPYGIQP